MDLGIAMMRPTAKARLFADFSAPYFSDGLAVMHRATDAFEHVSALSGRRLLSLARDAMGQDDERAHLEALAGHAVAPKPVANFEAAAALIEAGEADALISQAANIDSFLKTFPRALVRSPILGRSEFAVAIPKDNPALKALVDASIERLRANGSLQRWSAAAGLGSVHEGLDEHAEHEEAHRRGGGGQGRGNGGGHRRDRGR